APRRLVGVLVGRARTVPALCRDRRRPLPWRLAGESPIDVVATPRGIDENHLTGITIRLTESSPLAIQVVPHPRPAPFLERGTSEEPLLRGVDGHGAQPVPDRKSTRLNSSHVKISYAVFCLKKK